MWTYIETDKFSRRLKQVRKDYPDEVDGALVNLDAYWKALKMCGKASHVTGGYIHHEPSGVKALDASGECEDAAQVRLYVFPDEKEKRLYLLTIGDKASQKKEDLPHCMKEIRTIKK